MRLLRRDQLTAQPWRNGGGVTWQIAAHPPGCGIDGFDWRISMAGVAADGPFSAFAGIDRTLTVLDGAMTLDFGGAAPVALDAAAPPLAFPGEAPVMARLTTGPVLDLNVMTRRGAYAHAVRALPAGTPLPPGTAAVICRSAPACADDHPLAPGDCLLLDAADAALNITGTGTVIAVQLWPMDAAASNGKDRPQYRPDTQRESLP